MIEPDDNPFWTYSLALYGRDGVAAACLDLQGRLDLDVNVLLFCCWAGTRGQVLSAGDVHSLVAATASWRDRVVRPLRAVRQWLKTQDAAPAEPAGALRDDIKAGELAAEAIEQGILFRTVPIAGGDSNPEAVAGNLRAYLAVLGRAPADVPCESGCGSAV